MCVFVAVQVGVMLLAISHESLWIDEFWTAHLAEMPSFRAFMDLLLVPSGSQTPLHFLHFYAWEQLVPRGEFLLRLGNLPLFVAGQWALFWALRSYPAKFTVLMLALSALHPMVWQYANEARPYIMMYAGAQMMLAALLHFHQHLPAPGSRTGRLETLPAFLFVLGGILLFGASLLGAFWVFAASVYLAWQLHVRAQWRVLLAGTTPLLLGAFIVATAVLTAYYLSSLLQGAGASRLNTSSPATVAFLVYEVLGLAGLGPSRLDLRVTGMAALRPYLVVLPVATAVFALTLALGLKVASQRLGGLKLALVLLCGLFPVLVVIASGFAMHWRVLGRHMIGALPLLNLLLALGLVALLDRAPRPGRALRWAVAGACLLALLVSSLSLRFAPRHAKDDYKAAAALALQAHAQGQRVWWAADVVGAHYYGLPGEFDYMSELTSVHKPMVCADLPGIQSVPNATRDCLDKLSAPDLVILSKPETFDSRGDIAGYLKAGRFRVVQQMPAFAVWQRAGSDPPGSPQARGSATP
jgi:hypothetical protein